MNHSPFIFFGAGPIAARALHEMHAAGVIPALLVTSPDRPAGRGNQLTASPAAQWALESGIETMKPEKLDELFLQQLADARERISADTFVVIDYGKFLPKRLIDMAPRGVLNMHPSLLPRLRGPSPIRSSILTDEKDTGVTVMLIDEEMDHGPLLAQKKVPVPEWPPRGRDLDETLALEGGKLMAEILPLWQSGEIKPRVQNHDVATYCKMFSKEDGLLDLSTDPYQNLLKIRAFDGWPGTYTFFEKSDTSINSGQAKRIRVQILDASIVNGKLVLLRVKPEGKGEMSYTDFANSGAKIVKL